MVSNQIALHFTVVFCDGFIFVQSSYFIFLPWSKLCIFKQHQVRIFRTLFRSKTGCVNMSSVKYIS